jgi:hypothetical protein
MNRFQFVKNTSALLLCIPVGKVFTFHDWGKERSDRMPNNPSRFFPDKDNYLVQATCAFKTPGSYGDGKNKNGSFVDTWVDIDCYDYLYSGHGGFGDDTEIDNGGIRDMPIGFSSFDQRKIFFDGITNINVTILGNKPDQTDNDIPTSEDVWNLRWEFIMTFKKGQILSTGYTDPAYPYKFHRENVVINNPSISGQKKYIPRNRLLTLRTIETAD